ncbi:MAG: O-antigen ligase domain-containing protein [Chlamydiae bacterium]|nr:O-antigen ligase domain-containing protein [Chlamydiota bacterium]
MDRIQKLLSVISVLAILGSIHPALDDLFLLNNAHRIVLIMPFSLAAIWLAIREKHWGRYVVPPLIALIIAACWAIGRTLPTPLLGKPAFVQSAASLAIGTPFVFISAWLVRKTPRLTGLTIFLLGLAALLPFAFLFFISGESSDGFRAVSTISTDPNYQNAAFFIGFVPTFFLSRIVVQKKISVIDGVFYIIGVVFMLLTGARGSVVAEVCLAIVALIMLAKHIFKSVKSIITSVLTLGAVASVLAFCMTFFSDYFLVLYRFSILKGGTDPSRRLFLFTSAFQLWTSSFITLLIGDGLGGFPRYIGAFGPGMYPHNYFLEFLSETGIIGTLPIATLTIMACQPRKCSTVWETYIYMLAIYAVISNQFSGGISGFWLPAYFIFLSIAVAAESKKNVPDIAQPLGSH